jgi:hypothetical protein
VAATGYQYVTDSSGIRTHVLLPLDEFQSLLAQIEGLTRDATTPSIAAAPPSSRPLVTVSEPSDLSPSASEEVFTYSLPRKGGRARALWRYPTMVVLKGSTIAEYEASAMPADYHQLRQKLIDLGIIERIDGEMTFTRDHAFANPSAAACVIEGGSRDGYRSWKDSAGRTISDLGYSR